MTDQLKNIRHDFLRYANCWEDADLLLKALQIQPNDTVFSIGSAGDNSFSLLLGDPRQVLVVDINKVQLYLIELKKAAICALTREEFLEFTGFLSSDRRLELFKKVIPFLQKEQLEYWNRNLHAISSGIIHQGKFERYFHLFRTKVLPFIHSQADVELLFQMKSLEEQIKFYEKKWNSFRWRLFFKLFFSKWFMGKFGRDPEFLKQVEIPVGQFIFERAAAHLSSINCQTNYFLQYILLGRFIDYPHYVREENYDSIKSRLNKLTTFHGAAEEAFAGYSGFSKFNLSNIFEYLSVPVFKSVAEACQQNALSGAKFAYWNLMVPRFMPAVSQQLIVDPEFSQTNSEDNGFFYMRLNVDVKI